MVMRVRYELSEGAQIHGRASVDPPDAAGILARHAWERRTLLDVYRQPAGVVGMN